MTAPERPRDRLGRPLPHDADPSSAFPSVHVPLDASDDECWLMVSGYLSQGLPFHAHEVCEVRWRATKFDVRTLWKALAQWCAALTQEQRGNMTGARSLAAKACATLDSSAYSPDWLDRSLPHQDHLRLLRTVD